ncbi:putative pyridoxal-dependent decarboxylase domain-containing protein 2 [Saccoglossus kowalevskii]
MEKEREERWKMKHVKGKQDIPGPLEGNGQKLEDILTLIQDLILHDDEENKEKKLMATPGNLDNVANVSMISQGIAAYISTLEDKHLKKLSTRILSDTTLWLSRLFRFPDSSIYYHSDDREGLIRVCRLVLHNKYEKFTTEGFNALYTKPPVIYVSASARPGLGQYMCFQLGLPLSSLCTVPCNTVFGSQHTMDLASLERLIKDDIASSRTPVLLVANAGTPLAGHTDNINRLREICDSNGIWLHVEGHNLAALPLSAPPSSVLAAKKANSMTLTPSVWLGLPEVPAVTLYKMADPAMSLAAGLCSSQLHEKLSALPLWVTLQSMGHKGVIKKVKLAADLSLHMAQKLSTLSTIHLNEKPPQRDSEIVIEGSFKQVLGKTIQLFLQDDVVSTIVVFRYDEDKGKPGAEKAPYSVDSDVKSVDTPLKNMYNSFNRWLHEKLSIEVPKVRIDLIESDVEGVCLRFSPLQSVAYLCTKSEDVNQFIESLEKYVVQLNYTLKCRDIFQKEVDAKDSLSVVEVNGFGGIGAVQYIPHLWESRLDNLPDNGKSEIDSLNYDLVSRLHSLEEAYLFSVQKQTNGTLCVGVGVLTSHVEVEDLVEMIHTIGKEVEDSSKFLETMAEVIRKGIVTANEQLKKEEQDKLMEEGVLRQIPMVGSLVNWWSPLPKDGKMKGRSLNLSSGELESTETTYKYHMQIQQNSPATSPTKKTSEANCVSPGNSPLQKSAANTSSSSSDKVCVITDDSSLSTSNTTQNSDVNIAEESLNNTRDQQTKIDKAVEAKENGVPVLINQVVATEE